ncbi:hypothetical protein [Streptomyces sp. NPDC003077]|uniref:hypothetical protein n=1 Tax=Streptomyces sp. NPDC003077 TaxID=3154443 RepID=UPI0033A23A52
MRWRRLIPMAAAAPLLVGCGLLDPVEKPKPLDVTARVLGAFPDGPTAEKAKGYVRKVEKTDRDVVRVTFKGELPDGWVRYPGDDWQHYIAGLVMDAADKKLGPCHHQVTVGTAHYGFGNCHAGGPGYKDPHFG